MQHRTVEEQLAGLRTAVDVLARYADQAGPDASVPTCPAWTVRQLVAHQGMVHRWARANLLGQECHPPTWNAEGQEVADPITWLLDGAEALTAAVRAVPDDVRAMVFLKEAPAPRAFWARRQCHETTIHAVDALAAALGRMPLPEDADRVDPVVALDGIDELLTGFVTRGRTRFADVGPLRFEVRPSTGGRAWAVDVQPDGSVETTRLAGDVHVVDSADGTIRGSAVAVYLALWNRTTPDAVIDPAEILARVWRPRARVRWG